ncbi:hypothetical protein [Streptomyces sp. KL2]|uniref:hypothetical protein n=1 Tax=Streptomyces sp. KL2 TaxID=3050126 RepID=UPI00397C85A9
MTAAPDTDPPGVLADRTVAGILSSLDTATGRGVVVDPRPAPGSPRSSSAPPTTSPRPATI